MSDFVSQSSNLAIRARLRVELHHVPDLQPPARLGHDASEGQRHGLGGCHKHGSIGADEVVQLYIHDPVASISQPFRRLRDFQRVTLAPGETKTVSFALDTSDVGFYDDSGRFLVEPGQIDVYVGNSSTRN
jgi:Fibronectin type III-like domain